MQKMAKVVYKMPRPNDEERSPNEASEAKKRPCRAVCSPSRAVCSPSRAVYAEQGWSGATSKSLLCFARRATSLLAEQTLFPGFILLKLALSFEGI